MALVGQMEKELVGERKWLTRSKCGRPSDADFMYGEKDANGADTYVLCEINVSFVYPFPDDALGPLAAETLAQICQGQ